jgi:hypothetical protein
VVTTTQGRSGIGIQGSSADQRVLALCRNRPISLAEIAAHTRLPLGVARVLVGDLIAAGFVALASRTVEGSHSPNVLGRVLNGLRNL